MALRLAGGCGGGRTAGGRQHTWVSYGRPRDWLDAVQGEGEEFLEHATQVKNIWVPYGE